MLASPTVLLLSLATTVIAIAVVSRLWQARRGGQIAELARRSNWTYSRTDRFGLAGRVATTLDVPGAADLHVEHVCYRSWPCGTWFVFTLSYVVGVIRSRRRVERVVGWLESSGQCGAVARGEDGFVLERGARPQRLAQYAKLIENLTAAATSPPAGGRDIPSPGLRRR